MKIWTPLSWKKSRKLSNKYKDVFTDKEIKYLNVVDYNISSFSGLPKIHKSQLISKAIKEQNSEVVNIKEPQALKVRPIVEGTNVQLKNFVNYLKFC